MANDTKTLFRIFIQPQGSIDGQPTTADLMNKYGEFADPNYELSSINLAITNISNEDNRNAFYYDLFLACLSINKKIKSTEDTVIFFIKGIPEARANGIATAWANNFSLAHMIFFAKMFNKDAHIAFMFDLPYGSRNQLCTDLERNLKDLLTKDFFLEGNMFDRLKRPILTKSGIKSAKLKKIEKYLNKINEQEEPVADISFCFYNQRNDATDYPLTTGLFDSDPSNIGPSPQIYRINSW